MPKHGVEAYRSTGQSPGESSLEQRVHAYLRNRAESDLNPYAFIPLATITRSATSGIGRGLSVRTALDGLVAGGLVDLHSTYGAPQVYPRHSRFCRATPSPLLVHHRGDLYLAAPVIRRDAIQVEVACLRCGRTHAHGAAVSGEGERGSEGYRNAHCGDAYVHMPTIRTLEALGVREGSGYVIVHPVLRPAEAIA